MPKIPTRQPTPIRKAGSEDPLILHLSPDDFAEIPEGWPHSSNIEHRALENSALNTSYGHDLDFQQELCSMVEHPEDYFPPFS